ncbi:MAG TPA: hypothetical protein VMR21_03470 [Vicinamibacteria bacterium]|nr:hypothetical protein [Vicinamibacteria bacterium]
MEPRPQSVTGDSSTRPRKKDRHGFAVVLGDGKGVKVHGGPANHLAQADEKVTWTIVNGTDRPMTVELTIDRRDPPDSPATPFTAEGPYRVELPGKVGASSRLELRIRASGFAGESTYKYTLRVPDHPDSALDPELDIWP